MSNQIVLLVALGVLAVLVVVLGPMLVIWSLNVLFGLGIQYHFQNWLAALALMFLFGKNSLVTVKESRRG